MASLNSLPFIAIFLVLHLSIAKSDFLSPLFPPIFDDVCKEVHCGKGKCKPSSNGTLPYTCECDIGWKQTAADHDDHPKFLPCIFPNCTLDTSCAAAPPPVQEKEAKANRSIFDICRWTNCGGGSCNKTSPFTYDCKCSEGYFNLLNVSVFPCYRECAIGLDCANLGITTSNKSTSATPSSSQNNANRGKNRRHKSLWVEAARELSMGDNVVIVAGYGSLICIYIKPMLGVSCSMDSAIRA
ncbi:hypothetical protein Gohar_003700 [Gossypium harknessii]|uniref:EGF-like domain-containing protein n=1 Tax=Gossypium harknessii TaxID=34285 RepID=A0A7J9I6P6_9ROSI|nr:hypothetical protein [Gossypium harknessii]